MKSLKPKIVIVGAGNVGSTFAYFDDFYNSPVNNEGNNHYVI